MRPDLNSVLALFDVRDAGDQIFLGSQPDDGIERVRVFGGQVVAQALMAAARTVSRRRLHSVHAAFLRPGNPNLPLRYHVTTLREGRTFSTRRVSATQDGNIAAPLMEALVSFVTDVDGDTYQQPMPHVPAPETLTPIEDQMSPYADEDYGALVELHVVEMRYVDDPPRVAVDRAPAEHAVCRLWMRVAGQLPDELRTDPLLASCLLAYISDWTILDPVQVGIGKTWQSLEVMASLDHTMWFHRPVDFSDWVLFDQQAGSAIGGQGLANAAIYNRNGALVCTVAQEGFLGRRR